MWLRRCSKNDPTSCISQSGLARHDMYLAILLSQWLVETKTVSFETRPKSVSRRKQREMVWRRPKINWMTEKACQWNVSKNKFATVPVWWSNIFLWCSNFCIALKSESLKCLNNGFWCIIPYPNIQIPIHLPSIPRCRWDYLPHSSAKEREQIEALLSPPNLPQATRRF